MKIIFLIGLGSFIGGILRYLMTGFIHTKFQSFFPYGTLCVNIAGCFMLGLLLGISEKINFSNETKFFISTGILGGFTTFSAFSLETLTLMRNNQYDSAALYVTASLVLGISASFLGFVFIKLLY